MSSVQGRAFRIAPKLLQSTWNFGWLIIVTAVALLLPWRWHYALGRRAIPLVIRHMKLLALGAAVLGILIFYGVSRVVFS